MSSLTQSDLQAAIDNIVDPSTGQSLSKLCKITSVTESSNGAVVGVDFSYPMRSIKSKLVRLIEQEFDANDFGAKDIKFSIEPAINVPVQSVQKNLRPFKGIKNIIAIASGKGGVGKSTTTVNLALAMAAEGAKVGVLDADIYGPSIPRMLNISGRPETRDGKTVIPKENYGLQAMSIGFLVDEDAPMIWRGPMVTQALHQLLIDTQWDDLDYLFIDLPPGTGDIQLTLAQKIPVSGAIIVTTPQDIALLDARKALNMFAKVEVPVLGIVENMSIHICSNCGHQEHIFGTGGGERMSSDYGVDFLGSLPLNIRIREEADSGQPSVVNDPDGDIAMMYRKIAHRAGAYLAMQAKDFSHKFPEIVIEKNS